MIDLSKMVIFHSCVTDYQGGEPNGVSMLYYQYIPIIFPLYPHDIPTNDIPIMIIISI